MPNPSNKYDRDAALADLRNGIANIPALISLLSEKTQPVTPVALRKIQRAQKYNELKQHFFKDKKKVA